VKVDPTEVLEVVGDEAPDIGEERPAEEVVIGSGLDCSPLVVSVLSVL